MYPTETSLIPVTVALTRFVEANGLLSMFGHYPYWYLGVPFKFLTGPLVPLSLILTHKIFPNLSLFSITIYFVLLSFLIAAVGWAWLVGKIQKVNFKILSFIILLILPWRYLSAFTLSEASGVIAKNLIPFVLLAFWNYYKVRDRRSAIIAVVTTSFLLLINTTTFSILMVGLASIMLAASFRKGKFKGLTKKIKQTLILVLLSLILVTLWYTPGYWLTVLANPSIGGASGIKTAFRIFDLLKASAPLVLAVIAVYFSGKVKTRLSVFSLTWVFTFLFLTVYRFIGDPDFWQDWSSWFGELEVGVALIIAQKFQTSKLPNIQASEKINKFVSYEIKDKNNWSFGLRPRGTLALGVLLLLVPFLLTNHVYGLLHRPKLISNSIPQGVGSLEKLNEIITRKEEGLPSDTKVIEGLPFRSLARRRVFLSGSTVFWADALYDLHQVRGGVDKSATHPYWDHAAYQLREGSSPELAEAWLEALGVSYVLVHGPESSEAYHDFRNAKKWQDVGEIVWGEKGDIIVNVPSASLAWVVDLNSLERVKSPEGGVDLDALSSYLSAKKRPAESKWIDTNRLVIEADQLKQGEGVVTAVSHSLKWKSEDSKISKDPLGHLLIIPANYTSQTVSLEYR